MDRENERVEFRKIAFFSGARQLPPPTTTKAMLKRCCYWPIHNWFLPHPTTTNMSTTTFQQQPSLFQNLVGFNESMPQASPSSTPPKQSSDCGSSSGLRTSSEEASSLTSESVLTASAAPELVFSPPAPPLHNGPSPFTHAPFLSPIFMRPPPPQFYSVPNSLAAGLPHSSPNIPPVSTNSTTPNSTPNSLFFTENLVMISKSPKTNGSVFDSWVGKFCTNRTSILSYK